MESMEMIREELRSMNQNEKYGGDQGKPLLPHSGTLDRLCPLPGG